MSIRRFEVSLAFYDSKSSEQGPTVTYLLEIDSSNRIVESIFQIVIDHWATEDTDHEILKCGCSQLMINVPGDVMELAGITSEGEDFLKCPQVVYCFGDKTPRLITSDSLRSFQSYDGETCRRYCEMCNDHHWGPGER